MSTRSYVRPLPMSARSKVVHLPDCRYAGRATDVYRGWVAGEYPSPCAVCLPEGRLPYSQLIDELLTDDDMAVLEDGGWVRGGYSGLFAVDLHLEEHDRLGSELVAKMPYLDGRWCVLRPTEDGVLLVRHDWAAFMEAFTKPRAAS